MDRSGLGEMVFWNGVDIWGSGKGGGVRVASSDMGFGTNYWIWLCCKWNHDLRVDIILRRYQLNSTVPVLLKLQKATKTCK